jgi:hypothetical protein
MKSRKPKNESQPQKNKSPHRTNRAGSGIAWGWFELEAADRAREVAGKHGYSVYMALCHLESKAPSQHKAQFAASLDVISKMCGLSIPSVKRCLSLLRKSELITIQSGGLPLKSNLVTLHNSRVSQTSSKGQADHCQGSGGAFSRVSQTHRIKGRKESPLPAEDSCSSEKGSEKTGAAGDTPPAAGAPEDVPSAPKERISCITSF